VQLVRYEEMRVAVEQCARIDEASDLRDKAAALQAYARQRDDRDLDVWMAEIKLRASVRIGELVRELDTAQKVGQGSEVQLPSGGKSKAEAISEAGLTKSDAYRYQDLAGPKDQQAQTAGKAAAEVYFAQARATKNPATMDGLRGAVKDAVRATLGPAPTRKPPCATATVKPVGPDWVDWVSAIQYLSTSKAELETLVDRSPVSNPNLLTEAKAALPRLQTWIGLLEEAR
jgi:hypothetical protein